MLGCNRISFKNTVILRLKIWQIFVYVVYNRAYYGLVGWK